MQQTTTTLVFAFGSPASITGIGRPSTEVPSVKLRWTIELVPPPAAAATVSEASSAASAARISRTPSSP